MILSPLKRPALSAPPFGITSVTNKESPLNLNLMPIDSNWFCLLNYNNQLLNLFDSQNIYLFGLTFQ